MFRQSPRRNGRNKGLKIKHVIQICVLVAVSIWLFYQVQRPDNNKSVAARISETLNRDVKLGRKDLRPKVEETPVQDDKEGEEEADENEPEDVGQDHENDGGDEGEDAKRGGNEEEDGIEKRIETEEEHEQTKETESDDRGSEESDDKNEKLTKGNQKEETKDDEKHDESEETKDLRIKENVIKVMKTTGENNKGNEHETREGKTEREEGRPRDKKTNATQKSGSPEDRNVREDVVDDSQNTTNKRTDKRLKNEMLNKNTTNIEEPGMGRNKPNTHTNHNNTNERNGASNVTRNGDKERLADAQSYQNQSVKVGGKESRRAEWNEQNVHTASANNITSSDSKPESIATVLKNKTLNVDSTKNGSRSDSTSVEPETSKSLNIDKVSNGGVDSQKSSSWNKHKKSEQKDGSSPQEKDGGRTELRTLPKTGHNEAAAE